MVKISNADQLKELVPGHPPGSPCAVCAALACPGWESMPAGFSASALEKIATLRADQEPPTLEEFHPAGTHLWSADAPVAPAYHPYNLCDLYRCTGCTRVFMRYTEYGGYYEDERIRELDAALVR